MAGGVLPRVGKAGGALEHQGVHKGSGQVAAELALADVVFLGVQPRRSAGGPVAFEPAGRLHLPSLLVQGQGHGEPAEQERPLGVTQRAGLLAEPVQEVVLGELALQGGQGGQGAGIIRGQRAADSGQQQRGVQAVILGGPLPPPGGVGTGGGGLGEDLLRQRQPVPGLGRGRPSGADRPEAGDADQSALGPDMLRGILKGAIGPQANDSRYLLYVRRTGIESASLGVR